MSRNTPNSDIQFSHQVRKRAGWKCELCGESFGELPELLHCSHYFSRRHQSVRFDPDNAEALCFKCHDWMHAHPAWHREWKRARLGQERFEALAERARKVNKWSLI